MKTAFLVICVMIAGVLCPAETTTNRPSSALEKRCEEIILPSVEFNQANLNDVCPYLSGVSGVSIILGDRQNEADISIVARDISLLKLLRRISQISGLILDCDGKEVVLRKPVRGKRTDQ